MIPTFTYHYCMKHGRTESPIPCDFCMPHPNCACKYYMRVDLISTYQGDFLMYIDMPIIDHLSPEEQAYTVAYVFKSIGISEKDIRVFPATGGAK